MSAPRACRRLLLLGALLLASACASVPRATPDDARRASERWPGTTIADLDSGRSLFLSRCTSCHRPVDPQSKKAEDWPREVAEMKKRAKLEDREIELITQFLVTMAERPGV